MNTLSRKILKYCVTNYDRQSNLPIIVVPKSFDVGYDYFNTAIRCLINKGLIRNCYDAYSDTDEIKINVTSNGFEYFTSRNKSFVFKLVKFAISLTTLIISILTYISQCQG